MSAQRVNTIKQKGASEKLFVWDSCDIINIWILSSAYIYIYEIIMNPDSTYTG